MISKLVLCGVIVAVASLPQGPPSTSYGTPGAGSSGGSFGGGLGGGLGAGFGGPGSSSGGFRGSSGGIPGGRGAAAGPGAFRPSGPAAGPGSFRPSGPVIPILRDDRQGPDAFGNYNFNFETGNGISRNEQGAPQGPTGAVASQGGWSFTLPDGTPADFRFVADENGYRVESDLLPTPHPLPAHAIAQIEKARREDAAGVRHDSSGRQSGPGSRQFSGAGQRGFGSRSGQTGFGSGSGQTGFGSGSGQTGFGSGSGQSGFGGGQFAGAGSGAPSRTYGLP